MQKTALITGGASGIGFATCGVLGKAGYSIALVDIDADNGAKAVSELKSAGVEACFFQTDVTDENQVNKLVRDVADCFGGIDAVVNCAGGLVGRSKIDEMTTEFYYKVMDLNMTSAMYVTRAVVPYLKEAVKKGGNPSIVNITSLAEYSGGGPGASIYATSKAALHGFTKAMAKELIPAGVRVNAVAPGTIDTPFYDATPRELVESWRSSIPAQRLGEPVEIANIIEFLLSDKASFMVGEVVQVNGGQMMI